MAEQKKSLRLGFHTEKGIFKGIIQPLNSDAEQLKKYNFSPAAQIFTQVPQTSKLVKLEETSEIMKNLKLQNLTLVIHSPYSINDFWKKNDLTKLHNSLTNAKEFVDFDDKKNPHFRGIVIHLPKSIPEVVVDVIKNRKIEEVPILLENHAHKPGPDSYELPYKLNILTNMLIDNNTPNWGYCIDTAHLFVCISQSDRAAGYKIERRSDMERWLKELSEESRSRIKCWHLNGSVNPASSYNDKHSIPVVGTNHKLSTHIPDQMWGSLFMRNEILENNISNVIIDQIESLQECSIVPILKHAMHYDIPVILEINRGNADDVSVCLKILNALVNAINNNEF